MRYYFTPVRMAAIKNTTNNKLLARMWRKGNSSTLLVRMEVGAATMENSVEVFQKIKIELQYYLTFLLLSIHLKKKKHINLKDTCTAIFITTLFTIAKIWKQPLFINR